MKLTLKLLTATFTLGMSVAVLPTGAAASVIDVTPSNMGSWAFSNADGNGVTGGNPTGSGSMVAGPGTAPLGIGSANLATGDGTVGGDGAELLSDTEFAGLALGSITSLSYSTYDTLNNGQQFPYLSLEVETPGGVYDQLFFEPPYQTPGAGNPSLPDQGATTIDTWQTWNALEGGWWDNSGTCGSGGSGVVSFSSCVTALNDPTIVNSFGSAGVLDGVGGVQFAVGFASPSDQFNGYVDNFTIDGTTYNFDPSPSAVPEAPTWAFLLAGLGFLGFRRAIFRRHISHRNSIAG